MSKAFKRTQDEWSERLLSEEDLCDTVAFVGPERHRVPFHRAHLAIISEPLRKALYGEFKEGQTHELVLEDVTTEAFDAMLRSAYHLDLKLNPGKALQALKAARLYMIEGLEQYCLEYLQAPLEDVAECGQILHILTESLKHSISLPEELLHFYFCNILENSATVLQSSFFLETHGSIIANLIKLDEFNVKEDALWDRLVDWSSNAVQKTELLGPFASASPCLSSKRVKPDKDDSNGTGPHQATLQEAILRMISQDIRCTKLTKDFFVDKVRKYLDRSASEAIMDFLFLSRKPTQLPLSTLTERVGLDAFFATEQVEKFVAQVRPRRRSGPQFHGELGQEAKAQPLGNGNQLSGEAMEQAGQHGLHRSSRLMGRIR
eukprot:Skav209254  [mRNA]  locus=scaffold990:298141:300802:- [translate_table: standard]